MVGGPVVNGQEDYSQFPFNLATESERQPGSAFKPFTLAMALQSGKYGPDSIIDSAPQNFVVPNSGGKEHFIVHNFGNTYSGPITLQDATDDLRQHRVLAGRDQRRDEEDRSLRQARRHPHPGLETTTR